MKTMKVMVAVVLLVLANNALALIETVDGITWTYYVAEDGCAVLEHPKARKKPTSTTQCHQGSLPQTLKLPEILGECVVTNLGIIALRFDTSDIVDTIVVPDSYKSINGCAVVGTLINESANMYAIQVNWHIISEMGCTNIFFLGDRPAVDNPYYDSYSHYTRFYETTGYYPGYYTCGQFRECTCFVVEGTKGWSVGQTFCDGVVKYGAAKVDYSIQGGVVSEGTGITLSCPNKKAKIYYTLDGSEPTTNTTENCVLYNGPIMIMHSATLKALACVPNYPYTVTYAQTFALGQTMAPLIMTAEGNVFHYSETSVTITSETEGAEIHYTLDGSEPTESSKLYTEPFTIDDTTTVKAKAFKEDWFESETVTATFTREWYTVDTPVIEPSGAEFENVSQTVSLSCATDGATILYTTDGSDPKVNGREYTKPFTIYKSCTVRAIAVKYDWKDSAEATATFTRGESLSEAANLFGYTMETDSAVPWTVDAVVSHDGVSSVRSGEIGNNGTTYLMASVKKAGTVSFWWKAQCEEPDEEDGEDGYYDYGAFLVDDVVKARIAGNDTGWRFVSVEVPTGGKHVLRWEYRKDGATSYAPDCVWVDQVQWIPADGSGFTMTSPEQVPYSWLSTYGFGGRDADFETAANAPSGKQDGAGRATSVWQEYVAGTDPTNETSRFSAKIEMRGSEPIVTWEPDLNENGVKSERLYKVYGRESLGDDSPWQYPTNSLHRFFKVTVEMP